MAVEETWPLKLPGELAPEARRLAAGVALANQKIHDASQGAADSERMGTTLVAMHIGQGRVTIAHVGDSRAYKMRGAELAQLTEELTSTENKVAFARQAYNDSVTEYNTYKQTFPPIFFAGLVGHGADAELLDFDDAVINDAPKVSFG